MILMPPLKMTVQAAPVLSDNVQKIGGYRVNQHIYDYVKSKSDECKFIIIDSARRQVEFNNNNKSFFIDFDTIMNYKLI